MVGCLSYNPDDGIPMEWHTGVIPSSPVMVNSELHRVTSSTLVADANIAKDVFYLSMKDIVTALSGIYTPTELFGLVDQFVDGSVQTASGLIGVDGNSFSRPELEDFTGYVCPVPDVPLPPRVAVQSKLWGDYDNRTLYFCNQEPHSSVEPDGGAPGWNGEVPEFLPFPIPNPTGSFMLDCYHFQLMSSTDAEGEITESVVQWTREETYLRPAITITEKDIRQQYYRAFREEFGNNPEDPWYYDDSGGTCVNEGLPFVWTTDELPIRNNNIILVPESIGSDFFKIRGEHILDLLPLPEIDMTPEEFWEAIVGPDANWEQELTIANSLVVVRDGAVFPQFEVSDFRDYVCPAPTSSGPRVWLFQSGDDDGKILYLCESNYRQPGWDSEPGDITVDPIILPEYGAVAWQFAFSHLGDSDIKCNRSMEYAITEREITPSDIIQQYARALREKIGNEPDMPWYCGDSGGACPPPLPFPYIFSVDNDSYSKLSVMYAEDFSPTPVPMITDHIVAVSSSIITDEIVIQIESETRPFLVYSLPSFSRREVSPEIPSDAHFEFSSGSGNKNGLSRDGSLYVAQMGGLKAYVYNTDDWSLKATIEDAGYFADFVYNSDDLSSPPDYLVFTKDVDFTSTDINVFDVAENEFVPSLSINVPLRRDIFGPSLNKEENLLLSFRDDNDVAHAVRMFGALHGTPITFPSNFPSNQSFLNKEGSILYMNGINETKAYSISNGVTLLGTIEDVIFEDMVFGPDGSTAYAIVAEEE